MVAILIMTRNFCTSFGDDAFLIRGLALYYSLEKYSPDFILWVLCMDKAAFDAVQKIDLPKIRPINISEFEESKLLAVKKTRNFREYCITVKAFFLDFILRREPQIDSLSWLDGDLFFFNSVESIYSELGQNSILIFSHNYPKETRERTEKVCGKFNAGIILFKNDINTEACLKWWKERCLEWCYEVYDNGKYGEQLYLDQWPTLFPGVKVSSNQGINLAYWNIPRYTFTKKAWPYMLKDRETGGIFTLTMYHFSGLSLYKVGRKIRYIYNRRFLSVPVVRIIYDGYMQGLNWAYELIRDKLGLKPQYKIIRNRTAYYYKEYLKKEILSYAHEFINVARVKALFKKIS